MSMLTLRIISRLMSYPCRTLQLAVPEMLEVLEREAVLPEANQQALAGFLCHAREIALLELQERYVATFDRGRNLSLHLFEHVHGESRNRGQAMVDLVNHYSAHGFTLAARELPDHLPLMLEFLSTQPRAEAARLLEDAMPVIVLLGARLREAGSDYAVLFDAIEALAGTPAEAEAMRREAASEGPDETIQKMDEIWEEEQVSFLGNNDPAGGGCPANRSSPRTPTESLVQWTNPRSGKHTTSRA
jgi:nitrate reductase delta subunit